MSEYNNKKLSNKIELKLDKEKDQYYSNESILRGLINHTFLNASKTGIAEDDSPVASLDPGLFEKNPNGWDIQKACNWIHNSAATSSMHACAKYVRMAIEAGGLSTNGRPTWAWKYISYLPKIGFKFLDKVDNYYQGEKGRYNPKPGDIAVYTKGNDTKVPGHICMWTGAEWASDFRQNNMIVYGNTSKAYVFRFES